MDLIFRDLENDLRVYLVNVSTFNAEVILTETYGKHEYTIGVFIVNLDQKRITETYTTNSFSMIHVDLYKETITKSLEFFNNKEE